MDQRRLFTAAQKRELFVLANGKCQSCGTELSEEFDAHHKVGHANDGLTEVENGEALCKRCHQERHAPPGKYGMFEKDYSWQEASIEHFMSHMDEFYSIKAGEFAKAYINEVSPSGGKTIFSMKLAARLIAGGLIDKVIYVVPRENIKDGFSDDSRFVEVIEEKRLIGSKYLRVVDDLDKSYKGLLRNYHAAVITYHSLRGMYDVMSLLAMKYKLLFVFDEVHHGSTGNEDDSENIWGREMKKCQMIANAIVCMTGTPLRSDDRNIPFVNYTVVEGSDGRRGYQVVADYSFSYQKAVAAGIARKLICRSQDAEITYDVEVDEGEIVTRKTPISAIPSSHLQKVKNTAFCFTRGVVDDMLKIANDECERMRRTGDKDAAVLVIGRRDTAENEGSLSSISGRIKSLFLDDAIAVESADGQLSRDAIRRFKKSNAKWIVAKEMISEGTNIPRLRIVVILRDVGNRTFYEQLVHRTTRNDADDRPQDAIIIQLQLPHLHEWGKDLERQAFIGWEKQKRKDPDDGKGPPVCYPDGLAGAMHIEGISAHLEVETIVLEGEDFTKYDPTARNIHEKIGFESRLSRWQVNMVLKEADKEQPGATVATESDEVFTVEEQISRAMDLGQTRCKQAALNFGGGDAFKRIIGECKRSAGIRCKLGDLIKDHPTPLAAAQLFLKAATRSLDASKRFARPASGQPTNQAVML